MTPHTLFIGELKSHIRGEVLTDAASLGLYATDASVYQITPIVVVLPRDKEDACEAIRIAAAHKVAILPRGGGTSLAGQTVAHALVLDFSKYMNQLLELNAAERWAIVQPGMVRDELNALLQEHQLHFAPDPATSSRANVGGMIGNNSSGTKSILYGKTVDHVLELKAALADGTLLHLTALSPAAYREKENTPGREGQIYRQFREIIRSNEEEITARFPKVMRRVQGYMLDEFAGKEQWNLSKLICGSEGTLATILEAKINLEPLPRFKSVCVVHFSELIEAIRAVAYMLPFGPAAIEILDKTVVELSRKNLTTQRHCHFIEGHPAAIQIVEFYGNNPEEVIKRPQEMIAVLKEKELGYAYPLFPEGEAYEDVWTIRKKGLGLMLGLKDAKKPLPFIEDAGIPTEHLPEYISRVLAICHGQETQAAMYAHASVGVIHVRPILDLRDPVDIQRFKNIADQTFELVKEYGGSWSGEHGDGLVRSYYLERYFGKQVYEALRQIKRLFDPQCLMNPGKIIDAPPIDQSLRYGAQYQDEAVETVFHYREDGSFGNAVHMCTGVGECRKMLGGTMCPSFKATRDEEHSTRGRANALRLAMSGQLGQEGLYSPRIKEVLDLCLSCKACKSECPSNVDMAKLKGEVVQMHYDQHGASLRDRLIRDAASMAAVFSGAPARLLNPLLASRLFRRAFENATGMDSRRILPAFAPRPFYRWFARHYKPSGPHSSRVALFADTYLNYHEPEIGVAATQLLDALGYEVVLAHIGCCQRPKISHGFLKDAKKQGTLVAEKLDALIREGMQVLVCEPSCASALLDDLPDLIDDEKLAGRLQAAIHPLEAFIAEALSARPLNGRLKLRYRQLLLHGHCHQKALFGTGTLKAIFRHFPEVSLQEIPSGCCGMAGSFGYEQEHYDISEKIGEQVLFPVVRSAPAETGLIANGFSCRHQIEHFTHRKAQHWVEMIEVAEEWPLGAISLLY